MNNIFEICGELRAIFDEIEANEGEITPSLAESLEITQDAFDSKVKNYVQVIKELESTIEGIDKELIRLQDLKKAKAKSIDFLKTTIIHAINEFGDVNKSGNRFYDYGLGKITVRKTKAIEVDKDYIDNVNRKVQILIRSLAYNNELSTHSSIDCDTIKDFFNLATTENDIIKIADTQAIVANDSDLSNIKLNLTATIPLDKLSTTEGYELLKQCLINDNLFKVDAKVDKTSAKADIEEGIEFNSCKQIINQSLIIK